MIREALAGLARQPGVGNMLRSTPVAREVVGRLIAGESAKEAVETASYWADEGYWTALEWTGPASEGADALNEQGWAMAEGGIAATCQLALVPERLATGDAARDVEILDSVRRLAFAAGIDVVLGAAPEVILETHLQLAKRWADEGMPVQITIPASVRRAESLCSEAGDQRIRLVKGTRGDTDEPSFRQPIEVDKSFIRCAKALLRDGNEPSFATHDARLLEMVEVAAGRFGREPGDYEFTFFIGRQERTAARLLTEGHRVRLYLPYGPEWYGRLVGGLAEQSSSLGAAVRSLLPGA